MTTLCAAVPLVVDLEWEKTAAEGCSIADTSFGRYRILYSPLAVGNRYRWSLEGVYHNRDWSTLPTDDAAKAAAQADFNARILSSIIPATKPAVGVEALQAFSEQLQDYHAALAERDEHLKPGLSRAITLVAGAIMDRAALSAGTATPKPEVEK